MRVHVRTLASVLVILGAAAAAGAQGRDILPPVPTPTDIKPGSITCDECPYPAPSKYLDIDVYSQDVRISYMDIAPTGTANGHVVLLMHGNNFGGFYFGDIIDGLTDAGFRLIVPDQIGYGKSSKPIAPYNFNTQARNTQLVLEHEGIDKVMAVGHSMGGMLATRFTTQYPDSVERLVIYNPIGLSDNRFNRPMTPVDQIYERTLQTDYQSTRRSLSRYVGHDPSAWNDKFELYTRIRSSWTLSSDFPRLAMVQSIISQMLYQDPVVYDWPHIHVPTLAFGGAEDLLLGPAEVFQERMQVLADTVPNGNGRTLLFPGLGHVPHLERPDIIVPALVDYLMEGVE